MLTNFHKMQVLMLWNFHKTQKYRRGVSISTKFILLVLSISTKFRVVLSSQNISSVRAKKSSLPVFYYGIESHTHVRGQ